MAALSAPRFTAVEIIATKRDAGVLTADRIDWVLDAYVRGDVADEQMAALAMAIVLNGMTREEISAWTRAMINSGSRLDFSSLRRDGRPIRTVDKHSTGGVGDKITLVLAPLVAAYGVSVPQVSGRGLGHTGGTLDKLESIPGWRAHLTHQQLTRQLETVGAVICAAHDDLVPADRKLYALRDVTATVESTALIASSIMSKKIASGTQALVLDVKVGSGAFLPTYQAARELAEVMVQLGHDANVHTVALLTDMSTPLGLAVGNACEVQEALEVLAGGGPKDVVDLTLALAREMLQTAGIDADPGEALRDGRAMDTWRAMIRAQGGDSDAALPTARHSHTITAPYRGVLTRVDARGVGQAAWALGAGRMCQGDTVQPSAGVVLHATHGDRVTPGQSLATLYTDTPETLETAADTVRSAMVLSADCAGDSQGRMLLLDRVELNDL
ncbi:MAG: thymidine phosphorylase [Kocuria sp.]|nr:thymidine phosphorylase [Kocuria sp.]